MTFFESQQAKRMVLIMSERVVPLVAAVRPRMYMNVFGRLRVSMNQVCCLTMDCERGIWLVKEMMMP